MLIRTNPENRIQTRAHRIEDAIAAGVDALEAPGYVDRAERLVLSRGVFRQDPPQVLVQVDDVTLTLKPADVVEVDDEQEAPAPLFEQPAAPAPGTWPEIPAFLDRRSRLVPGKKTKPAQLDFFA